MEKNAKVTVGFGTPEQRELNILEYVICEFRDDRLVCVNKIEDGSFVLSVKNPSSTGRATDSTIWLSKESFIGLMATAFVYLDLKKEDFPTLVNDLVEGDELDYYHWINE